MAHQYLCANLSGADLADRFGLQHAIDGASEMILVPYFLVGAFLLKIATSPPSGGRYRACIYGLWLLLYASRALCLLLSVVLYAPGLLVFLYARRTHKHDNVLNRREVVLIGLLLVAAVPATCGCWWV